jgi:hypothetical protein
LSAVPAAQLISTGRAETGLVAVYAEEQVGSRSPAPSTSSRRTTPVTSKVYVGAASP